MKILVLLTFCVFIVSSNNEPEWMKVGATPKERALALLKQMTLQEKLSMVHGYGGPYVGNIPANSRLNIPALNLEDGPQGVADGVTQVTCWPSALTIVASWDIENMRRFAAATANEERLKGTNIFLSPMVNIARVPFGGRNFESFGEDPFLAAEMVRASISGIQSQGVIATVKHFTDNNQEYNRTTTSANLDERTQFEIYYPAFKAAIEAGVGAVMCSYNRINDTWACENDVTLNKHLKGDLGFEGFVMSDWGATHSTVKAANAGLDMEMPDSQYFGKPLADAVAKGEVTQARLDDMVYRVLVSMFSVGLFDNPQTGNLNVNVQSAAHTALARELSAKSTVLLKNQGNILPLDPTKYKKIAIIGDDGDKSPTVAGDGSGHVIPPYIVSPLAGIKARVLKYGAQVAYAPTLPLLNATKLAASADLAIVFVSTTSSEGIDRTTLSLGDDQNNLVKAVASSQPNTIVVAHIPGAVLMPWETSVPAILAAFMPGQETGNAIADVLFGDVNPSAKLPLTFPLSDKLIPVNTVDQYPGVNNEAAYSEGLLVGYRWYDAKRALPLYPFGHGLSYTTFTYSNLVIKNDHTVSFDLKNTGSVAGAEVAQLYLGFPSSAGEPPQQLKRFKRVDLEPGHTVHVTLQLKFSDFQIWDIPSHSWTPVHGTFNVAVGSSSRDIRLRGSFVY